ncbi:MAG: glycosyltransferase family 2 protein [Promethearchaeota archaeon]|nr:MAG: glycosyltransferase family 2 protein [Candidatus Lokiarchaeota archaeon]
MKSSYNDIKQIKSVNHLYSIIIPMYNEEHTIKEVIKSIPNHRKYKIFIVDDGSNDKSLQKLKDCYNQNIEIVCHTKNLGYGAALITGFKHAMGDIILTLDCDGQHDPMEIEALIKPIIFNKADVTIGSRYLGSCNYKVPLYTRLGEFFIKIIMITIFHQKISNNQSGYRCFRREILNVIDNNLNSGMGFTTEFLFECAYHNLKIIEIPINLNSRKFGHSSVELVKLVKEIMNILLKYFLKKCNSRFKAYFMKIMTNKFLNILYKLNKKSVKQ